MRAAPRWSLLLTACGPIVDDAESGAIGTDGTTTSMTSPSDGGSNPTQSTSATTTPTTSPVTSATVTVTATSPTASDSLTASTTDEATTAAVDSSSTASTTETGEPSACEIAPDDSECVACTKASCCDGIEACEAEYPGCGCVVECTFAFDSPGPAEAMQCASDCDVDFLAILQALLGIQTCRMQTCPDVCAP